MKTIKSVVGTAFILLIVLTIIKIAVETDDGPRESTTYLSQGDRVENGHVINTGN